MSLRNNKVSGILTLVLGLMMSGFGAFGLLLVTLMRQVFRNAAPGADASAQAPTNGLQAIHEVFRVYLPIMIVGGLVFTICGYYVRRGSLIARRVAQATALCGYLWIAAYYVASREYVAADREQSPVISGTVRQMFDAVGTIGSFLLVAAVPSFILFILSRPRSSVDIWPERLRNGNDKGVTAAGPGDGQPEDGT